MVAALFERTGEAEQVVQLRELPIPVPGPGEVLVQVQAASLQPADRMFIGGAYRHRPLFPQRAGLVGAGIVTQCGDGVGLEPGTPVAFRHPGAWGEFCVVPAARLFLVPEGVGMADASQFALNPVTAWALLDTACVGSGDWLAVNAARSNVATMVRALAGARGVHVADIPGQRAAGADGGHATISEALLTATGGESIAAVLDAVGGPQMLEVLPTLRQGALIVSYGLLEQAPAPVRNADLIYKNLTWIGFGIDHWLARHAAKRDAMLRELWEAIVTQALPLPVRARFPLVRLHEALRAEAAGGVGKVLLMLAGDA